MDAIPAHWQVYFAVDDCDAACEKITGLGGSVVAPPFDTPPGRMAAVADPVGGMFSIIAPAEQPAWLPRCPACPRRAASPTSAVVVTGGASGIGRACANALAEVGRAIAVWDVQGDTSEVVAEEVRTAHGVAAVGLGIDVTQPGLLDDGAASAVDALGPVGGLVHAAGTVSVDVIGALYHPAWDEVVDVNLTAHAMLTQALLPHPRASGAGAAVVGISSIEGIIGPASIPAYCASEAGLPGLTRSWRPSSRSTGSGSTPCAPAT